ncbi:MAG: hypothetical protein IJ266_04920 [Elusimicrobiaceae bacterium]|nr:hypothetical protein [Elusimicrobiaceae bacterium]
MKRVDNSHLKALFKLLETETDQYGPLLKQALASAIKANPDEVQRTLQEEFSTSAPRNVLHMLEEICWEDLGNALATFNAKINPDLDEGLLLLAKFTSPTTARGILTTPLDNLAQQLRAPLLNATDYPEIINLLSHFIFHIQQFQSIPCITDIRDLSFPRFLETKRGSALTIACLYLCLGQRFGIEMDIVDMAGKLLVHVRDTNNQTSFLIDPLDNGKMLREEDCKQYIQARGLENETDLFVPLTSRLIVRRFIANMIYILNKIHDQRRLYFLRNYLEILKN